MIIGTSDLDAIRARLDAATPGPWRIEYDGDTWEDGHSEEWPSFISGPKYERVVDLEETENLDANAAFIANAPADIAALLAEVERLAAKNAALRGVAAAARALGDEPAKFILGGGAIVNAERMLALSDANNALAALDAEASDE